MNILIDFIVGAGVFALGFGLLLLIIFLGALIQGSLDNKLSMIFKKHKKISKLTITIFYVIGWILTVISVILAIISIGYGITGR